MKIIDIAEHYAELGGGVKSYINQKLKNAARLGHEMIIVAPGAENKEEEKHGGRIIWQKNPPLMMDKRYGVFKNQKAIYELLDKENPDIVEGSSIWSGGRAVKKWKGDALKLFIFHQDVIAAYAHTFLDKFMKRENIDKFFYPMWKYLQWVSNGYDHTIVSGDWLADRLNEHRINNPLTVPFGIDKTFFTKEKKSIEVRKELLASCDCDEDVALLIVASRFHPEKRLRTLFEAVNKVNLSRSVAMVVYGEGFLSQKDRAYAASSPTVRLAGFTKDREELATAYASADLMLHGSAAETFGLGVAEGLCSGLPVVAPSVGGAADLVGSKYGILYEPGNVDKCSSAIIEALDRPREDWDNNLKSVGSDINSVEDHFDKLFELYEEKLNQKVMSRYCDSEVDLSLKMAF